MKYITSILRKKQFLCMLLVAIWLIGCVQEDFTPFSEKPGKSISFALTVSDVDIPSVSSRSMTGSEGGYKEDEVQNVDILVFDASKTPAMFLEWVEVKSTAITQTLNGTTATATFSAPLTPTNGKTCIMVVANRPTDVESYKNILAGFKKEETTKVDAMEAMVHIGNPWQWPTDGPNDNGKYLPIPMCGEKEVDKIAPSMEPIGDISLKRMLARIDIVNSTSNFTVDVAYLVNYNNAGYVAPVWDANGKIDLTATGTNIPGNNEKKVGVDVANWHPINGNTPYKGNIYTFEAPAAVDSGGPDEDGDASRKDAVCLIIGGRINEEWPMTFYRVDFTKVGGVGEAVKYLPLLRNHKYVIDITEVSGLGYEGNKEALESYTMLSNLKMRLITYDRDKVKDVVYDGQYMLGVGKSEIEVTQFQNNSYVVDVFTDVPGGWKAIAVSDNDWLKFDDGEGNGVLTTMGQANEDTQIKLRVPFFTEGAQIGDFRTATIKLQAGRLTYEIEVRQIMVDPGIIKFVDGYGNELEGLVFPLSKGDPNNAEAAIEAQVVYAMFSTHRIDVKLEDAQANMTGIIRYPNGGIVPDLTRTSSLSFWNRVQAFSIQPEPRKANDGLNEWWRTDKLIFSLYNEEGEYLGYRDFELIQSERTFLFRYYPNREIYTFEVDFGAEQYLQLSSNNNWKIIGIEEVDGTGLMLSSSNDGNNDVFVGRSNKDSKMYLSSVVDSDDDGAGNNIVGRGYDFRLKFLPSKWQEGKTGMIKIDFENEFYTGEAPYKKYPFYTTLYLKMVSNKLSYTDDNTQPLFYLYPLRFDNRKYYEEVGRNNRGRRENLAAAAKICEDMSDDKKWRLPNASELIMSYIFQGVLGGSAYVNYAGAPYAGQNIYGWYTNWSPDWSPIYWSSSYYAHSTDTRFQMNFQDGDGYPMKKEEVSEELYFRCVRNNDNAGTKYPYITKASTGVTIVSRDNSGGINTSLLFASGETPGSTSALNKIAPKLEVENTSRTGVTYAQAVADCKAKGGNWRLPTHREAFLIMSMGGTTATSSAQGFNGTELTWTGNGYEKISGMIWTQTVVGNGQWGVGAGSNNEYGGSEVGTTTNWMHVRCVRTVN